MKLFFDERCLAGVLLLPLLRFWREVAETAAARSEGLSLFLDRSAVDSAEFLRKFNALSTDMKVFFRPMVFGAHHFNDWRPVALSDGSFCQLETEEDQVNDCAVCEVYEHLQTSAEVALFGAADSSFASRSVVGVVKANSGQPSASALCGSSLRGLERICVAWGCWRPRYELTMTRPPRDDETILEQNNARFERTGRIERHGRRRVYREIRTGRLLYVDNLHYGAAAHIEVFDSGEQHLGVADLDGNLDASARIPGRVISW